MKKHMGWIALDIDGTITDQSHQIAVDLVEFLTFLESQGWQIIFITGRTFSFANRTLHPLCFPYYLAVQNGADLLSMPRKQQINRHYLDKSLIPILERIYQEEEEDFLLYAGYEQGDFCYYRPSHYSAKLLKHLNKLQMLSPGVWQATEDFSCLEQQTFPLIKALGSQAFMQRIQKALEPYPHLTSLVIRDPLNEEIYLNLITEKCATKGYALTSAQAAYQEKGPVIAAGDDFNDISMLELADVKIVMVSAPIEMHAMATILASPKGILSALQHALHLIATQKDSYGNR